MHFPGNDTPNARADIDALAGPVSIDSRIVEIDHRFLEILDAAPIFCRNFRADEIDIGAKVALVNLPFARKYFGEQSALGRHVRPAGSSDWHEIVGVVPDLALNPGAPSSTDGIYLPWASSTIVRFGVRTSVPARTEHDLHEAALQVGLRPQVQWTITLEEQMAMAETIFRVFGSLLLPAGGAAMLLACAGICAIVAFDVIIDSASNNHRRFVRAQFTEDLIFAGYEQDRWVEVQRYQDAPWRELVGLWAAFNRHMARVMASAPESARLKPRQAHNLHQLAWKPIPADQPATLDYFMRDYVAHLEHHLKQIFGDGWRAPGS